MANEIQDILFDGTLEAGSFTLTFDGDTTASLNWDDNAATVEAALEALASIGSGNISVSSVSGGFRAEFVGSLANTNVATITASSSLKRQADTITIGRTQTGIADTSGTVEIQRLDLGGATTGTFRVNGNSTFAELDASLLAGGSAALQTAMDSIWGGGAVTVTGGAGGPFDMTWTAVGVRAEQTISDNSTDGTPEITTTQEGVDVVPGRPEIFTVTLSDAPTEGRFALNINASLASYVDFDATAAELETALETIPYACGVTGSDGGPWTVTSDANIASPTIAGNDESGVAELRKASAITVTVVQQGSPANVNVTVTCYLSTAGAHSSASDSSGGALVLSSSGLVGGNAGSSESSAGALVSASGGLAGGVGESSSVSGGATVEASSGYAGAVAGLSEVSAEALVLASFALAGGNASLSDVSGGAVVSASSGLVGVLGQSGELSASATVTATFAMAGGLASPTTLTASATVSAAFAHAGSYGFRTTVSAVPAIIVPLVSLTLRGSRTPALSLRGGKSPALTLRGE